MAGNVKELSAPGSIRELSAPGSMKELSVTDNMKESVAASSHTIQKEVECVKQEAQFLSTDLSTPLLSPRDSPSSVSIEYKFSPKSPSPSPSSLPFTPSSSSSASWSLSSSCHSQSSVPDTVETFDRNINLSKTITKNSSLPSKSSSVSLAQRRGSVSPSLQLPVSGNDSFCGSKRMSKRTHVSLFAVAKEMVGKGQTVQSGTSFSSPEELCTGSSCERESQPLYDNKVLQNGTLQFVDQYRHIEDSPTESFPLSPVNTDATSDGNPSSPSDVTDDESCPSRSKQKNSDKRTRPMLYDWPKLERLDMFDISYLDSSSVFILLAPSQIHDDDLGYVDEVYVWVGSELIADKESIQRNSSDDRVEFRESDWKKSALDFLERMDLQQDTIIRVVRQGEEPDEFWEHFVSC